MTNAAKYVSDKFDGGGARREWERQGEQGEGGGNGRGRERRERDEEGGFNISLEPNLVGGWYQHVLHSESK